MKKTGYNLIVIKIGSSSLTDKNNKLDIANLARLSDEIAVLQKSGKKIILVTSGAIVSGAQKLNLVGKLKDLPQKQAAAAIGQSLLMKEYDNAFGKHRISVAQILLTRDAIGDRDRYVNSRNTLLQLLEMKVIPIVNENDTVAVEEIKVGDNDTLSALVASLVGADLLINLTDVDGFYMQDGVLSEINEITEEIEKAAMPTKSKVGTGGMQTKLEAAKICSHTGVTMVIANGRKAGVISALAEGEKIGTAFTPAASKKESKKRWLAHGLKQQGTIIVDSGAENALLKGGKSLLPIGIKSIKGKFEAGTLVSIANQQEKEIARGLINISSNELEKVVGKKGVSEVIHRDNLVVL